VEQRKLFSNNKLENNSLMPMAKLILEKLNKDGNKLDPIK
jgi:hypothetical protein